MLVSLVICSDPLKEILEVKGEKRMGLEFPAHIKVWRGTET